MCFCFFVFGSICQTLLAAPTKGFSLGIKIGTFPIVTFFNSYHFGGEVGYQLTNSVSIIGEFAYGEATNSWHTGSVGSGHRFYDATYSCIPIRASLLLPLIKVKTFLIYWGLGLGYYFITIKTYEEIRNLTETTKIKGLAPHLNIGMELRVLKRVAIFGELKYVFGSERLREIEAYADSYYKNVHFRRPELITGIRFYFQD
jgi:hypothetical protein